MGVLVFSMKKKKPLPAHALDNGEGRNVIWVRTKILCFMLFTTRGTHTMCVSVSDCYFIVNVLDLPFASPITIYRQVCIIYRLSQG